MAETTERPQQTKPPLSARLASLVWRVNQQLQWLQGSSATPSVAPKRRVPCLVLGRGLYQEAWQSYNIRSASALKKILQQKAQPQQLQFIGPWQDNQRRVLTLTLNADAMPLRDKAYVLLPESLVLGAALPRGLYQINDAGQNYFFYQQEKQWQTLLQSKLVNDANKARLALGCSSEMSLKELTPAQLQALIPKGVSKLGLAYWQQGWQGNTAATGSKQPLPWPQLMATVAIIGASYLALSSGYLLVKQQLLSSQLESIQPQVSELLQQQSRLQQARSNLAQLNDQLNDGAYVNQFWQLIAQASENGTTISYVTSDAARITIGGESPDALALLKRLHALPQVEAAEFAAPVRDNRGVQAFRIDVILKPSTQESQA